MFAKEALIQCRHKTFSRGPGIAREAERTIYILRGNEIINSVAIYTGAIGNGSMVIAMVIWETDGKCHVLSLLRRDSGRERLHRTNIVYNGSRNKVRMIVSCSTNFQHSWESQ